MLLSVSINQLNRNLLTEIPQVDFSLEPIQFGIRYLQKTSVSSVNVKIEIRLFHELVYKMKDRV